MKKILTTFLLATCGISYGQNLIPNGDFEQYWHCPTHESQIDSAKFWFQPHILSSSDYFNQCASSSGSGYHVNVPHGWAGFQQAHSGAGYAGIALWCEFCPINYREYIETSFQSLSNSLVTDQCYHFQMYINLGNACKYSCHNIGVYFSDSIITGISGYYNLPFTPQITNTIGNVPDTLNWTLVSGDYVAHGGESYLIIGNFDIDLSTDTIDINSTYGSSSFNLLAFVYIDDVSLTHVQCTVNLNEQNEDSIILYPNPLTDRFTIDCQNNEPKEIILYDLSAKKLLQQTFTNTITINTEYLAKGMYFYKVQNKNGIIKYGKVIKE